MSGLLTVLATMLLTLLLTKRTLSMPLGSTLPVPPSREARLAERAQSVAVHVPDPSLSWGAWVIENGPHYIATRLTEPLVFVPLVALGVVCLLAQRRTP